MVLPWGLLPFGYSWNISPRSINSYLCPSPVTELLILPVRECPDTMWRKQFFTTCIHNQIFWSLPTAWNHTVGEHRNVVQSVNWQLHFDLKVSLDFISSTVEALVGFRRSSTLAPDWGLCQMPSAQLHYKLYLVSKQCLLTYLNRLFMVFLNPVSSECLLS